MEHTKHARRPVAQGDVLLYPVADIPAGVAEVATGGAATLARGEATGHHHSIHDARVRLFREDGSGRGLHVLAPPGPPAELRHQEHAPVPVAPGAWRVIIQRTYSSGTVRRVAD